MSKFKKLLIKDFPQAQQAKESIEQNYWNNFEVFIDLAFKGLPFLKFLSVYYIFFSHGAIYAY